MAAADCESEFLIFHWDIPPPILPINLLGADSLFGEFLYQLFGQPFSPAARIDLCLFAFIWGELGGTKFDLSLHAGFSKRLGTNRGSI
jgi:hypothetical protein